MAEKRQLPVITISREYGACGRTVARTLAQRFGIEFYDRDFVRMTARKSGFSEEDIEREGEQMSRRARLVNDFLRLNTTGHFTNSYDAIFQAEREVILELAKSPCIIVGRCSNFVLREEHVPSFDIFLYADKAFRVRRAAQLAENGDMDLEKYVDRRDHWRETFYRAYTGREMGYYKDYNICVDVGRLGVEQTAQMLGDILAGEAG